MFWLAVAYIVIRLLWEFFRDVRWGMGIKPNIVYFDMDKERPNK